MNAVVLELTVWQLLALILVWLTASVALGLLLDWARQRFPAIASFRRRPEPEAEPVQMVKVHIPTFGRPVLTTYDSSKFVIPLVCADCENKLEDGDEYYEIPITDGEPGSVTAVHLSCSMYALVAIPTTPRKSDDGDRKGNPRRKATASVRPEHGPEEASPAARRVRHRR